MTVMDAGLDDLLASPEFITDPYPVFRRLREESPVHWVEPWGCWLLTRAEDIDLTIRDTRRFSSTQRVTRVIERTPGWEAGRFAALHENFAVGMAQTDPPDHTRVRGLVSAAFTPRRVENRGRGSRSSSTDTSSRVLPTGRIELVADLAHPLPAVVIAELSGFPVADRERFRDWTYRINAFFFQSGAVDPVAAEDADAAVSEARDWIHDLLDERRAQPTDDLLSALVAADFEGGRLTEAELLSTAITLFLGGHDTTTQLIALGMSALVRHPAQLALLRERPDLVPAAVEEMLRYDAPFQMNLRYVTEDTEIGGRDAASRRPRPPGARVGRPRSGPLRRSRCVPDRAAARTPPQLRARASLLPGRAARPAPGQIVVETLVRRLPGLRLDPDADERPDVRPDITNRGLRTLHLAFDPPPR